jgi:tetratricopeptide (TPR) repeat protein
MPKRDVKVISHSVLTNHRIVRTQQEPFPEIAFHMTTPELPDLVDLTAPPGKHTVPPPVMLLQAYRQVMLSHPEYRERYWNLGKDLERTNPNDVTVMQAMAARSLKQNNVEGIAAAIHYLERLRVGGATQPADFEQLAKMLVATHQETKAIQVLKEGIDAVPHDAELYQLLGKTYLSLRNSSEACKVASKANHLFPQDDSLRVFLKQCEAAKQ